MPIGLGIGVKVWRINDNHQLTSTAHHKTIVQIGDGHSYQACFMSFFNWFSGKSRQVSSSGELRFKQTLVSRDKLLAPSPQRTAPEPGSQEHKRKLERYARREQLYVAIREAMTRAGILSASYKFKVLSLDRRDSEFLVMMDLGAVAGDLTVKTAEIETLVVHNAKARFDITVSAVYWRLSEIIAAKKAPRYSPEDSIIVKAKSKAVTPHQSIEADEMAAFQRALLGGHGASRVDLVPGQDSKGLRRRDLRTRSTKPEYAEASDSVSPRSLSGTQYGDLN